MRIFDFHNVLFSRHRLQIRHTQINRRYECARQRKRAGSARVIDHTAGHASMYLSVGIQRQFIRNKRKFHCAVIPVTGNQLQIHPGIQPVRMNLSIDPETLIDRIYQILVLQIFIHISLHPDLFPGPPRATAATRPKKTYPAPVYVRAGNPLPKRVSFPEAGAP